MQSINISSFTLRSDADGQRNSGHGILMTAVSLMTVWRFYSYLYECVYKGRPLLVFGPQCVCVCVCFDRAAKAKKKTKERPKWPLSSLLVLCIHDWMSDRKLKASSSSHPVHSH